MTENSLTSNLDNSADGDGKPVRVTADPYYVVLPCEVKDFSTFVSGLLGKPQELRGQVEGKFKISHRDVENIYHLIHQRISKQNESNPIHFTITVYYNDGQSVTHNNISDFNSYHPISKAVATGVIVSATYLIKFVGKSVPEKQELEVIFATHPEWHPTRTRRWFNGGLYQFKITHTERTWAEDIAGLLTKHGESLIQKPAGALKWLLSRMDEITAYLLMLIFCVSLLSWSYAASGNIDKISEQSATIQVASALKSLLTGLTVFSVVGVIFVALSRHVDRNAFIHGVSAILFTEHDRENYAKVSKATRFGWISYLVAWVVSIALGVLSNVVYSKNWFW